jgi:hypothetical protein
MAARRTSQGTVLVPPGAGGLPALPADWQEEVDRHVADAAASVGSSTGWPFISLKGGVFTINGEESGKVLDCVLLGAVFENDYYEGEFDPQAVARPVCQAIAKTEDQLAPSQEEGSRPPKPQHERCAGCWANAFNTDPRGGKGKACKNLRRLALLPADRLDAATLGEVAGARLRVPLTSVREYAAYANKLATGFRRPLFSVVTRLELVTDTKALFKLTFAPLTAITDAPAFRALASRADEAGPVLLQSFSGEEAPERKGGAGGPARRVRAGDPAIRRRAPAKVPAKR